MGSLLDTLSEGSGAGTRSYSWCVYVRQFSRKLIPPYSVFSPDQGLLAAFLCCFLDVRNIYTIDAVFFSVYSVFAVGKGELGWHAEARYIKTRCLMTRTYSDISLHKDGLIVIIDGIFRID